ncbi:hypothetical protein IAT38_005217 [Cryptococcus sp. DSM 104549]
MPPAPQPSGSSSQAYRNPVVDDDDDDDDLDDLDNVLQSFNTNKPKKPDASLPSAPAPAPPPSAQSPPDETDEDFEASLMEGMEGLLRQLAGDHPPGVMPDIDTGASLRAATAADEEPGAPSPMSKEAEEEAWQKAVQMLLSGEGLSALGLDDKGSSPSSSAPSSQPQSQAKATPTSRSAAPDAAEPKPSYEEAIRKTLDSLKTAGQNPTGAGAGGAGDNPELASLLASLGSDPDLLKGLNLGGDGEDGDLEGMLEGMMAQLMTKEVLEEPMAELADKYPAYLSSPPEGTSKEDLDKYKRQSVMVTQIVETFRKPTYSDEKDGKDIARLVSEMQDLGGPPKEIMGDLPEGFDLGALGALGSDDGCTIM